MAAMADTRASLHRLRQANTTATTSEARASGTRIMRASSVLRSSPRAVLGPFTNEGNGKRSKPVPFPVGISPSKSSENDPAIVMTQFLYFLKQQSTW